MENSIEKQILDLLINNKSASEITHILKKLGNGNMQDGLSRIADFFKEENNIKVLAKGRRQGMVFGLSISAFLATLIILYIKKEKKKIIHETEGQKILETIKSNVPTSETPINTIDSDNVNSQKEFYK